MVLGLQPTTPLPASLDLPASHATGSLLLWQPTMLTALPAVAAYLLWQPTIVKSLPAVTAYCCDSLPAMAAYLLWLRGGNIGWP